MRKLNTIELAARDAWRTLALHNVKSLLSKPISNPKLNKSLARNVLSAPLHLAPAKTSGFEVCPMRTAGCTLACLHTAGNPAAMRGKRKARNARTKAFFRVRDAFMTALAGDIEKLRRQARKRGMRCAVRLNATSDIVWESMPVTIDGRTYPNLMTLFGNVTFYDYTKRHNRRNLPSNYTLTYSLAEDNDARAVDALASGMNVAAVFDTPKGQRLPDYYGLGVPGERLGQCVPVIDGDVHDFRPIDRKGVIVGLRAKGRAKKDKSGFVRKVFATLAA
jgi:hypothetical protein